MFTLKKGKKIEEETLESYNKQKLAKENEKEERERKNLSNDLFYYTSNLTFFRLL